MFQQVESDFLENVVDGGRFLNIEFFTLKDI